MKYKLTEAQLNFVKEINSIRNDMTELGANIPPRQNIKYRAEVAGIGENTWSTNAIEYDTPEEAKKWLDDLSGKWFGYDMSRVVPIPTPRGEEINRVSNEIYQNFRQR